MWGCIIVDEETERRRVDNWCEQRGPSSVGGAPHQRLATLGSWRCWKRSSVFFCSITSYLKICQLHTRAANLLLGSILKVCYWLLVWRLESPARMKPVRDQRREAHSHWGIHTMTAWCSEPDVLPGRNFSPTISVDTRQIRSTLSLRQIPDPATCRLSTNPDPSVQTRRWLQSSSSSSSSQVRWEWAAFTSSPALL